MTHVTFLTERHLADILPSFQPLVTSQAASALDLTEQTAKFSNKRQAHSGRRVLKRRIRIDNELRAMPKHAADCEFYQTSAVL